MVYNSFSIQFETNKGQIQSSTFNKSNDVSTFSETFSAQHKVVFTDKTHLASARSAFSAVFSVFSGVGSPEQVGHLWCLIKLFYIK